MSVTRDEIFIIALKADHAGQVNLAGRLFAVGACMGVEPADDIGFCGKCYRCDGCKGDAAAGRKLASKSVLSEF